MVSLPSHLGSPICFLFWTEVFPCREATATSVAEALLWRIITAWETLFQLPCNWGAHFTDKVFQQVYNVWPVLQHFLEKATAPHSSTLAWKIPWMEEPGRLQSMGLLRVGHDWATSLSLCTFMYWRRKWQPTPVFLPGESQGQGSLVGCHLWGRTELDTTKAT